MDSPPMGLWWQTAEALATPRRLLPILGVALPLLASQHAFSERPWIADGLALGLLLGFWLTGPWAWRRFAARGGLRGGVLYAAFGLLPFAGAVLMTELGELPPSFLVHGLNGGVAAGLFLVGGWGLGRDIELELDLLTERARAERLRRQAEAAELLALRSSLDPHFLFNTLNAIAEWCTIDPVRAEAALLRLSALLRDILGGVRAESWPLARELGVVRDVLELHGVRDPDRFTVQWDVAFDGGSVPPLLLLPLVENAVKYGPARGHRGPIGVRVWRDGENVCIELRNPGPPGPARDGGEGLRMVRERLRLAFGENGRFELLPDGTGTLASVRLPIVC